MKEKIAEECTLALGDCIEEMKSIQDSKIDLILTDPPYNLGLFMQSRDTNLGALRENHFVASHWDHIDQKSWEDHMNSFFKQSSRILKKKGGMLIFMSIIKVETLIRLAEKNGFYYKTTGVWHKKNPMPRNMNLHFVNSTEAWVYFINNGKTGTFNNKGKVIHDFFETSVIGQKEKRHGKHPTQKPQLLMECFIKLLSDEGELILDPFMGSGSTGVAALNTNRCFYGIELDKSYYELSKIRISETTNNLKLI